ncbi:uncharacterized protein BJ212DRAFT_1535142 [Suillus subaureus]|uniref:Uncharacterized protein n=1 Tax=Suillus subaureus TaxID=48587 RepID=A0A9P7E0Q8_9AGAM|nr:uncharacterized protein BJ212DRAFT_1535142 [Suillus subaureus]KAG1807778.1 hypothetical protein BJ212DRAFT_1535142 [Suillus subaureus]
MKFTSLTTAIVTAAAMAGVVVASTIPIAPGAQVAPVGPPPPGPPPSGSPPPVGTPEKGTPGKGDPKEGTPEKGGPKKGTETPEKGEPEKGTGTPDEGPVKGTAPVGAPRIKIDVLLFFQPASWNTPDTSARSLMRSKLRALREPQIRQQRRRVRYSLDMQEAHLHHEILYNLDSNDTNLFTSVYGECPGVPPGSATSLHLSFSVDQAQLVLPDRLAELLSSTNNTRGRARFRSDLCDRSEADNNSGKFND